MADVSKLLHELSGLTVLEAAELARLLKVRWQLPKGIHPTLTAGGASPEFSDDQAAIARREAFQFQGNSSAMRLAG
jgi:hypothetical protein